MQQPVTINSRIVEGLYCEALVLSDEVRFAFTLGARVETIGGQEDGVRIAFSSEGLRTTTRMMHAIAWLLNHRAYFLGELSELQLRRYGRLSPDLRSSDPAQEVLLPQNVRDLIGMTVNFYDRLLRLDASWRDIPIARTCVVTVLRERLEGRIAV
jgi:regulator of CtrA degradation